MDIQQQQCLLQHFDYNISTVYTIDDESETGINVHASVCNRKEPDELFLEWVANHPGRWSCFVQIFFKNLKVPSLTIYFKQSILNSYSQSFTENSGDQQNGYLAAELKEVTINKVQMN